MAEHGRGGAGQSHMQNVGRIIVLTEKGFLMSKTALLVALRFVCKLGSGVTPIRTFYALAAKGATSARRALSVSRSAGVMVMPRHRFETSTSTA